MPSQAIDPERGLSAASKRAPVYVTVSAWAVPILMVGQFALVAALPIALIVYGAFRVRSVRALRWWASVLAGLYAMPLIFWLVRENGAQSLSKDIHPAFVGLVTATALVILVKLYRSHRY